MRSESARWMLLLASIALLSAPDAQATETRAEVANLAPEILVWTHDARPDGHAYRVEARDANGVEDLVRIRFRIATASGTPVHDITDAAGVADARRAVVWSGPIAHVDARLPYVVTLTVFDAMGGETSRTKVVAGTDGVPEPPVAPETRSAVATPPRPGLPVTAVPVSLLGLALSTRLVRRT